LNEKTIVAISTPLGKGAIGIIRLSGKDGIQIIKNFVILKNSKNLENLQNMESHKLYLATILAEQIVVDEVMIVLMKSPK